MLSPSRRTTLAMVAYAVLAFAVTAAAGDLGNVGFWIVWIPVVAILLYLCAAGVALAARALRR